MIRQREQPHEPQIRGKDEIRILAPREVEVLLGLWLALTKKAWATRKDIQEEIQRTRESKGMNGDEVKIELGHISKILSTIRDRYQAPENADSMLITYWVGRETRYQLNGKNYVTSPRAALVLHALCKLSLHHDKGVTEKGLLMEIDRSEGALDIEEVLDLLSWASDPSKAGYITKEINDGKTYLKPTPRAMEQIDYFAALKDQHDKGGNEIKLIDSYMG